MEYANIASSKEIKGMDDEQLTLVLRRGCKVAREMDDAYDRAERLNSRRSMLGQRSAAEAAFLGDPIADIVVPWYNSGRAIEERTLESALKDAPYRHVAKWCGARQTQGTWTLTSYVLLKLDRVAANTLNASKGFKEVQSALAVYVALDQLITKYGSDGTWRIGTEAGSVVTLKIAPKIRADVNRGLERLRKMQLARRKPADMLAQLAVIPAAHDDGSLNEDADVWLPRSPIEFARGKVNVTDKCRWTYLVNGSEDDDAKVTAEDVRKFRENLKTRGSPLYPRWDHMWEEPTCDIEVCDWTARDPTIELRCPFPDCHSTQIEVIPQCVEDFSLRFAHHRFLLENSARSRDRPLGGASLRSHLVPSGG
jgi:hypothetical protein